MNNAYRALEDELMPFKSYLIKEAKLSESTASDYIKRIISICKEEGINFTELEENIERICFDYVEGEKQDLGRRSHNSYRGALLQFKKFVTQYGGVLSSYNTHQPKYHFEINKVPNEHLGIIKLYDENHNLIDTNSTISREHHTSLEVSRDIFTKCIEMMFSSVYNKDYTMLIEVLKSLDVSLSIDGKEIIK